jgi:hypothetical protein
MIFFFFFTSCFPSPWVCSLTHSSRLARIAIVSRTHNHTQSFKPFDSIPPPHDHDRFARINVNSPFAACLPPRRLVEYIHCCTRLVQKQAALQGISCPRSPSFISKKGSPLPPFAHKTKPCTTSLLLSLSLSRVLLFHHHHHEHFTAIRLVSRVRDTDTLCHESNCPDGCDMPILATV